MIKFLLTLTVGMIIGGAWTQYRITGTIWGRPTIKAAVNEAIIKNTYAIAENMRRKAERCYDQPSLSVFPVITIEPYDEVRLRCFDFIKPEDGLTWVDKTEYPTLSLPLEERKY